jgi:putative transcriptional regulator
MAAKKNRAAFGERMVQAAREAAAIARGEADPATYRVVAPVDVDVGAIRRELKLTQDEFSARFGLPIGTVRDWEQHRRQPDQAARVLLQIIRKEPKAAERALKA